VKKIVTLIPSATEIVAFLGQKDFIVGGLIENFKFKKYN